MRYIIKSKCLQFWSANEWLGFPTLTLKCVADNHIITSKRRPYVILVFCPLIYYNWLILVNFQWLLLLFEIDYIGMKEKIKENIKSNCKLYFNIKWPRPKKWGLLEQPRPKNGGTLLWHILILGLYYGRTTPPHPQEHKLSYIPIPLSPPPLNVRHFLAPLSHANHRNMFVCCGIVGWSVNSKPKIFNSCLGLK